MKNFRRKQFARSGKSLQEKAYLKTICPEFLDRPKLKHMQTVLGWLEGKSSDYAVQAFCSTFAQRSGVSALQALCLLHYALKEGAAGPAASILDAQSRSLDLEFKPGFKTYVKFTKEYLSYLRAYSALVNLPQSIAQVPEADRGSLVSSISNPGTQMSHLARVLQALHVVMVAGLSCLSEAKSDLLTQICHFFVTDLVFFSKALSDLADLAKVELMNTSWKEAQSIHHYLSDSTKWDGLFCSVLDKLAHVGVRSPGIEWIRDTEEDQYLRREIIHQLKHAGEINVAIETNRVSEEKRKKQEAKLKRKEEEEKLQRQKELESKAIFDCLADLTIEPVQPPQPVQRQPPSQPPPVEPASLFGGMGFQTGQMMPEFPVFMPTFATGPMPGYFPVQQPPFGVQPNQFTQPKASSNPFDSLL